ncbi:hypothetical protein [Phenylobacterium sp.]|jgi:hypothetical protein|uniref:hypothetical protein n=1 Tax=Phenylobacterium sp. TaxID=1871053 RepID=UPI0012117E70|nr:hypothetical protein [Phenylobacterium sp.]THD51660.1 MAG: hypothetical protein E8A12_20710 [Phenylobacterium sp.]
MKRTLLLAGLAAMQIGAGVAAAKQTEPAPASKAAPAATVSGVTVNAPQKENPLVDPTTQFVRQHLPDSAFSGQLARFRDEVCVKVVGLPPEFDAFIAKHLIDVAAEVHAPIARAATCTPNVNVVFTPNPQAQLDDIAKRKDVLLGFHFLAQTKKLTTVDRPIQAWYVTRTRDTTGNSWLEVANPCPANVGDTYVGSCGDRPMGRAGSRLGNDMSAEVVHSLILADTNKLAGVKIEMVADYIAVLALAKWQGLDRCNATPTILNRMADGCDDPPDAATPQDLALLTGLYSVEARESGSQQRATIASAMRKAGEDHR